MDGASTWRIFRSVTLPLMKPTIVMCLVYCVTGSILAFDQFFILTKGGPNNATMTVVELIYNFAFDSKKDLGMAPAALSLIVLVALVHHQLHPDARHARQHQVRGTDHDYSVVEARHWTYPAGHPSPHLHRAADLGHRQLVQPAARFGPDRRMGHQQLRHVVQLSGRSAVYLFNSVVISLITIVLSVVVCTMAGYSFSRFQYPGRNLGFMVTLSILMVPYASLLIPLMVWYSQIGLNNTLVGIGLVITLFQLPMSTFIMRNAFDAIPKELEEAAMVDGCNSLQALIRVLVPVVKPSMVTVGLLAFLEAWNNFMIPLYLAGSDNHPAALAMVNMRQQTMGVMTTAPTEAGVVVLMIPAAILFLALQKYYARASPQARSRADRRKPATKQPNITYPSPFLPMPWPAVCARASGFARSP